MGRRPAAGAPPLARHNAATVLFPIFITVPFNAGPLTTGEAELCGKLLTKKLAVCYYFIVYAHVVLAHQFPCGQFPRHALLSINNPQIFSL